MVNAGKYTKIPYCMDGMGYETIITSSREGSGFSLMPKIRCSGWVLEAISWSSSINALGSVQDRMGRAVGLHPFNRLHRISFLKTTSQKPNKPARRSGFKFKKKNEKKHKFSKNDIKCAKRIWQVVLQVYIFDYICLTWNSTVFLRLGYKLYPRPPIQSIPSTQFSSLIWTEGTGSSSKWHLGPLGGISPASCSRRSHSPAGSSNKMPASTPQWPWDSCAPLVGGCALFIVFFLRFLWVLAEVRFMRFLLILLMYSVPVTHPKASDPARIWNVG